MQLLKRIISVSLLLLFHFAPGFSQEQLGNSLLAENNKGFKTLLDRPSSRYDTSFFTLNSETKLYIRNYLDKRGKEFQRMEKWGKPYFLLYNEILTTNDLPVELKYLSVVESGLNANVLSSKGALGPWQLMPDVAAEYGLKLNGKTDERTNLKKSTVAACLLLKDLYNRYQDWLLVIAAYNAGSGRVNAAIRKAGSSDFWELQYFLPEETRAHVKRYIAAHYFFEGSGGPTTLTRKDLKNRERLIQMAKLDQLADSTLNISSLQIIGKYNAVAVARHLQMDLNEFNSLNPSFDKNLSEGKYYNLRLPEDKLEQFKDQKLDILKESVELFLSGALTEK